MLSPSPFLHEKAQTLADWVWHSSWIWELFWGCTCLPCSSGVGVPWCVVHDENIFPSIGFCECPVDVASWVVVDKGGLNERLTPAGIRPGPKLPRGSGLRHPKLFSNTTHKASFSKGSMQVNLNVSQAGDPRKWSLSLTDLLYVPLLGGCASPLGTIWRWPSRPSSLSKLRHGFRELQELWNSKNVLLILEARSSN